MNSCLSSRVCNGFTFVELLVTISIVAVLLSVGLPSFVTFVSNNQISSATNDLVYSIHMARSENDATTNYFLATVSLMSFKWHLKAVLGI